MAGFNHQNKHHFLDVWDHTLYALSISSNNYDVRLALLLHDIGKPFSYIKKDNIRYFFGHQLISANIAKNILIRLDYEDIDKM